MTDVALDRRRARGIDHTRILVVVGDAALHEREFEGAARRQQRDAVSKWAILQLTMSSELALCKSTP